jgi:DNA polymerase-3 subunit epsilon
MLHESLVILDFETTGLSPEQGDRITEVGLVRVDGGRIVDRYQSLANCRASSRLTPASRSRWWMMRRRSNR